MYIYICIYTYKTAKHICYFTIKLHFKACLHFSIFDWNCNFFAIAISTISMRQEPLNLIFVFLGGSVCLCVRKYAPWKGYLNVLKRRSSNRRHVYQVSSITTTLGTHSSVGFPLASVLAQRSQGCSGLLGMPRDQFGKSDPELHTSTMEEGAVAHSVLQENIILRGVTHALMQDEYAWGVSQ